MARTNLPITALVANDKTTEPAYSAADAANGMTLAAGGDTDRLFLHVRNADAAPVTVTVKAGSNPPAVRASIGDLAAVVASGEEAFVGPLESARFVQADGSVYVDFDNGTAITVAAYRLPRYI